MAAARCPGARTASVPGPRLHSGTHRAFGIAEGRRAARPQEAPERQHGVGGAERSTEREEAKVATEGIQRVGAVPVAGGAEFTVWAPESGDVDVVLRTAGGNAAHALTPVGGGWFRGRVAGSGPGDRYCLRLDGGQEVPDPLSRSQPDGVHGDSEVIDIASFAWTDEVWSGIRMDDLVIYEAHVGAATPDGTFDALIPRLQDLVDLGVTALELMPVATFPGSRNWGYDGVYPFAPAHAYGGGRGP
jgi:maltooligosyltrehalose trehalohydrolase